MWFNPMTVQKFYTVEYPIYRKAVFQISLYPYFDVPAPGVRLLNVSPSVVVAVIFSGGWLNTTLSYPPRRISEVNNYQNRNTDSAEENYTSQYKIYYGQFVPCEASHSTSY